MNEAFSNEAVLITNLELAICSVNYYWNRMCVRQ